MCSETDPGTKRLVVVSGMMGSGKTTLCEGLAPLLGWEWVGEAPEARAYLAECYAHPTRWAFESQIAFITYKVRRIRAAIDGGKSLLLERSLGENVDVYGRCYFECGDMDVRAYETYRTAAEQLSRCVPEPDAMLICQCPREVCEERISLRGRACDHALSRRRHEVLATCFDEWLLTPSHSPRFAIDTARVDTRRPEVLKTVARELLWVVGESCVAGESPGNDIVPGGLPELLTRA